MSTIQDSVNKEVEFRNQLNHAINCLVAVRDQPFVKIEEREKALEDLQKTLPLLRRYLWYFKTMRDQNTKV